MDDIWFFLPGLIALGLITSWEDWKEGKIRNKWVVLGLAYAFFMNTALLILNREAVDWGYALEMLTNILFAVAAGFGLWYAKVWTAGDGKLFIAFAAILPLGTYSVGYIPVIPSASLLMNIFIIGGSAFLFVLLFSLNKKEAGTLTKAFFTSLPTRLPVTFLFIFSISWAIQALVTSAGMSISPIGQMAAMFVLFAAVGRSKWAIIGAAIISTLRLFLDPGALTWETLVQTLSTAFLWQCILFLASESVFRLPQFTQKVKAKDLRPGMILKDREERDSGDRDGLTAREIETLRKKGKEHLISRTIPFAPVMAMGVILTLLSKGNLLIVLRALLTGG